MSDVNSAILCCMSLKFN